MGIWFLSSFFGNYFAGFVGTFGESMPRKAFYLMLIGLGLGGGVPIRLIGCPLEQVVANVSREWG
ncbi:MAG: hypothetical protein ABSH41_13405 [Syntrophobacteraceae bacterium]|jgi:POT family proton-dependent oligopeptide transporter